MCEQEVVKLRLRVNAACVSVRESCYNYVVAYSLRLAELVCFVARINIACEPVFPGGHQSACMLDNCFGGSKVCGPIQYMDTVFIYLT